MEIDASSVRVPDRSTDSNRKRWRKAFIRWLRKDGNITRAARLAGIDVSQAYRVRRQCPRFAAAWAKAAKQARRAKIDLCEREALHRAVHGHKEPVYQGGELVGFKRKRSDTLLVKILEAESPRKYAKRSETSHTSVSVAFTVDARQRLLSDPLARELACALAEQLAQPKAIEASGSVSPLCGDSASDVGPGQDSA